VNSPDQIANDQSSMTNGGGRAKRAVNGRPAIGALNWSLGFVHFRGVFAKAFANNAG
jgi:hypothetical protein